jgi:hypothetical protein
MPSGENVCLGQLRTAIGYSSVAKHRDVRVIMAYAMILGCSVFLAATFLVGWSAEGLFSSKPFAPYIDWLLLGASVALVLILYQYIAA